MAKMMPAVTKPVTEWTPEERWAVMTNNLEWIRRCMDYHEEEKKNQQLLDFLESKK